MTTDLNSVSTTSRRWLQLISACLTALLIPLCFTGPAVVLPSISQALGGTPVELNWVLNGYILAYGSVIMVAGSLVDLIGPRRVLAAGPGAVLRRHSCCRWRRRSSGWTCCGWSRARRRGRLRRRHVLAGAAVPRRGAPAPSACWAPPSASACPSVRWPPAGWSRRQDGNGCSWPPAWSACWARPWSRPACARRRLACAAGSTGAARSASPARWACSPAACCGPKPAGAVPAYWARCWHLPCWPWPSCASSAASPARCWSWACSATPASSACRRWPPRPPFFSSR